MRARVRRTRLIALSQLLALQLPSEIFVAQRAHRLEARTLLLRAAHRRSAKLFGVQLSRRHLVARELLQVSAQARGDRGDGALA